MEETTYVCCCRTSPSEISVLTDDFLEEINRFKYDVIQLGQKQLNHITTQTNKGCDTCLSGDDYNDTTGDYCRNNGETLSMDNVMSSTMENRGSTESPDEKENLAGPSRPNYSNETTMPLKNSFENTNTSAKTSVSKARESLTNMLKLPKLSKTSALQIGMFLFALGCGIIIGFSIYFSFCNRTQFCILPLFCRPVQKSVY